MLDCHTGNTMPEEVCNASRLARKNEKRHQHHWDDCDRENCSFFVPDSFEASGMSRHHGRKFNDKQLVEGNVRFYSICY